MGADLSHHNSLPRVNLKDSTTAEVANCFMFVKE
jgi:hypothetical protein